MKKTNIILFATLLSSISALSQVTPSSGISGSGTTGYIPKFTSSKKVGNSSLYESSNQLYTKGDLTNSYFNFMANTSTNVGSLYTNASNGRFILEGKNGYATQILNGSTNIYMDNSDIYLSPNGSTALLLKSNGNVCVGTTSVVNTEKMRVFGAFLADDYIVSRGSSNKISIIDNLGNDFIGIYANSGQPYLQSFGYPLQINPLGNDVWFSHGSTKVGIGTSSPTAKLHVYSSSGSILKLDGVPTSSTSLTTSDIYAIGNDVRIVSAITTNSTVTQATSKTTSVTINTISGDITTNNSNMAANQKDVFTVSNSSVSAGDLIILNHVSGGDIKDYSIKVGNIASGSFQIMIKNENGGGLTDALVLRYKIVKK